jgi:hypothetical protein
MVRKFRSDPVDDATVRRLLAAAIRAPSAGHTQPWAFIVVRDGEKRRALGRAAHEQTFIGDAPVVVVACADLSRSEARYGERARRYGFIDAAFASLCLLLAVTEAGLGACFVGADDDRVAACSTWQPARQWRSSRSAIGPVLARCESGGSRTSCTATVGGCTRAGEPSATKTSFPMDPADRRRATWASSSSFPGRAPRGQTTAALAAHLPAVAWGVVGSARPHLTPLSWLRDRGSAASFTSAADVPPVPILRTSPGADRSRRLRSP